ncbi:non-ribosomal peptide synthetase, partial [Pseudomonas sp. MAFF212428]|nr:non-ribosomal peptide synthetase [Pseudomonas brassicae]
ARLMELDAVREAVVLALDTAGGQQLVGYVVPGDSAGQDDLREHLKHALKAHLPDYMIPAQWVWLEQMPLSPNGKLERKALPKPDASQLQREYVAPQSELEQRIAGIWQQMLNCEHIGLNDDFFELGGHSLLATQVISRVRQVLGFDVALRTLFEHSRLADFVATLNQLKRIDEPPLIPVERNVPLPLSYAQERQWFLWQLDPQSSAYHLPAALRLRGYLDLQALQRSFDTLLARHESLRTLFTQADDQLHQVVTHQRIMLIEQEVLTHQEDQAAQIGTFVETEINRLFALDQGPLLRVKLLQLAAEDHVLIMTQHHIISDAWSMQVMVDELISLYSGYSSGHEAALPVLPIQYADYALWQREWMEAGERDRQLNYWLEQLSGEHSVMPLPTDRTRPAEQSFRGAHLALTLDQPLALNLKKLAQQRGITPFMLLMASFQVLLHRYNGQREIRVGVPVANRNRMETERLIGFFVNTLVLKSEIESQHTVATLFDQVRNITLQAQAHQDLPFEQLVEALQPERSLSHNPLFQVMFSHQGETRGVQRQRALPNLDVEFLAWDKQTAQFDLMLHTSESAEGFSAVFTYATDLFEATTIERLALHWQNLLRAIATDPQQRISELPLLDTREQQANIQQWNPAPEQFTSQRCIHELIEAQAARAPDAIALTL